MTWSTWEFRTVIGLLLWLAWRSPAPSRLDRVLTTILIKLKDIEAGREQLMDRQEDLFELVRCAISEAHGAERSQAIVELVRYLGDQRALRESHAKIS